MSRLLTKISALFFSQPPRGRPTGRRVVCLLLCVSALPIHAAPPGYDAARRFAHEFQTDYAQRGLPALTERLDSESMRRRVLTPLGSEALKDPQGRKVWSEAFWPAVHRELEPLGKFPTLLIEQPALVDGERVLGTVFLDEKGNLQALSLWLAETGGKTVVVDYRSLAQSLPASRRFRHLLLLQGAPFNESLDQEERTLCFAPMENRRLVQLAFAALAAGRLDDAHRQWDQMTAEVKGTAVWRELRDMWATFGCEPAWHQWRGEYQAGRGTNPLLALAYERAQPDKTKALVAIDQLIARAMNSPFLRTVKAELLLETGRPAEALALAGEIFALNPFATHACPIAIGAALSGGRPDEALAALEHWSRFVPATQIEEILHRDPRTEKFRTSSAYLAWRQAQPAAPLTAPRTE